jgi:hypothetical protein
MMNKLAALALAGLLVQGCTNPHTGQIDPTATTLAVGAGVLAAGALGYAAGQNSVPSQTRYHYRPAPVYRHHYYAPPPPSAYRPYYGAGHRYFR